MRGPAWAEPQNVLLGFFGLVTIPTDRRVVGSAFGAVEALLGVVATREVVDEQTKLPFGQLQRRFSAHQPRARKRINALAKRTKEAKVVARFGDASNETATLRAAEHVAEAARRFARP